MPSIESILGQIATEAADGPNLGSLDRCTTTELAEAKKQFPHQFPGRSARYTVEDIRKDLLEDPGNISDEIFSEK